MQFFKGDEKEQKIVNAVAALFTSIKASRTAAYNDCYTAHDLGEASKQESGPNKNPGAMAGVFMTVSMGAA